MGQQETSITNLIKKHLKGRAHWWGFKYHGTMTGTAGIPDLIGCYRGLFVAFEVKTPTGTVSRIQEHIHKQIEAAGGKVFVVTHWHEVFDALDHLDTTLPPLL